MKKLSISLMILIIGCAPRVTTLNVPGIEHSEAVIVNDLRPDTEKERTTFSLLITSEAYATYRLSETSFKPPATRLLQHRAFEKFGTTPEPLSIAIHHLVIYRNMQAEVRRGAIGSVIGGAIGAIAAGTPAKNLNNCISSLIDQQVFDATFKVEYKRALYTPEENPGHGSVYIVYIDTEIRGKRIFSRTIAPQKTKEGNEALSNAIETAVQFQLSQY